MALAFAMEITGARGITMLSAGTDGPHRCGQGRWWTDQPSTSPELWGMDPLAYLDNDDSYTYFQKTGNIVITGSIGTRVMITSGDPVKVIDLPVTLKEVPCTSGNLEKTRI